MKIATIRDIKVDAAQLVAHVNAADEPVLVVSDSQPAAYLVGITRFEAMAAELAQMRHAAFWKDVEDARAEYLGGKARAYSDVSALLVDLGLPIQVRKRSRLAPKRTCLAVRQWTVLQVGQALLLNAGSHDEVYGQS